MLILACILIPALLLSVLGVALLAPADAHKALPVAQLQPRHLRTQIALADNWVLTSIEVLPRSEIARVTLKHGENQTVFARVDIGKAWPIDPIPHVIDRSSLGARVALLVGPTC